MIKNILALETSCDDTSVAVVQDPGCVLSVVSANQDAVHAPFGGVVPEIASRNHSLHILPLIQRALLQAKISMEDLHGIAVTNRPGLIGSLIVGVSVAKTLAQVKNLPLIGVNHLEGHILAPFLSDDSWAPPGNFKFPFVALAVSGGHTSLYRVDDIGKYTIIGRTKDDAAGEVFDKFGKMLGLGFPGGAQVDRWAQKGNPEAFEFPRGLIKEENLMMSFSGLKSAAHRLLQSMSADEIENKKADLCASFQESVVEVLLHKLQMAVDLENLDTVVITGGVCANSRLRSAAQAWAAQEGLLLVMPPMRYCTDNAAMIGYAGLKRLQNGERFQMDMGPSPSSSPGDLKESLK